MDVSSHNEKENIRWILMGIFWQFACCGAIVQEVEACVGPWRSSRPTCSVQDDDWR